MPFQKCRVALDSVVFVEEQQREDMATILADIIAHMGQDVSFSSLCILNTGILLEWLIAVDLDACVYV